MSGYWYKLILSGPFCFKLIDMHDNLCCGVNWQQQSHLSMGTDSETQKVNIDRIK